MLPTDFLLILLIPLSIFGAARLGNKVSLDAPGWVPKVARGYVKLVFWVLAALAIVVVCFALLRLLLTVVRAVIAAYQSDVGHEFSY